ncbi:helix-turn-helix domain-containing protein [Marinobacter zhanjiangensis]|uniref:HTH cro/C1-type domain-containing protein n=1 Tax=Marinobacter zhanjiangensis TaxID=578215 RepID=A0ABQ3AP14_9GAMM|nr:helix-turn-helix transcriptional regulator [Marinobacter zhanjiangensis]GGY61513.1 hypothetical protein GCM10007071_05420 [Marinobacter zhanjiangensis]
MFHYVGKATYLFPMATLLEQLKKRRTQLGLKQSDMMMRVGMSRQQYQRLESHGNPRLDTLELVAEGLNSELVLVPREKLEAVRAILNDKPPEEPRGPESPDDQKPISEDPWQGLLEDTE